MSAVFFYYFAKKSDIYGFFLGIFAIFLLVFIFSYIIILKLGSLLYGFYSSISFLIQRIKESKNQRIKESKNQRIKESKNQRIKESKNQRIKRIKESKNQRIKESKESKNQRIKRIKEILE
ncbi:hypothetical protein AB3508_06555 [Acinetobacter baumannii]